MKKENYRFLYPSFVNVESAISIANSNIGLKNSIYKEAFKKKKKLIKYIREKTKLKNLNGRCIKWD